MPKFVTIGYGDEAGYQRTPQEIRDAAHAHDDRLKESGAVMGIAGLPIQVRNPEGDSVQTTTGPYLSSSLILAKLFSSRSIRPARWRMA